MEKNYEAMKQLSSLICVAVAYTPLDSTFSHLLSYEGNKADQLYSVSNSSR